MTIREAVALCSDETVETLCVIARRFTGKAEPGSRVDLGCMVCGGCVSLDRISQQIVDNAGLVFCHGCWAEIGPEIDRPRNQIRRIKSDELSRNPQLIPG
jgi:hypothetical protein